MTHPDSHGMTRGPEVTLPGKRAPRIYQDLIDDHGVSGSYSSVRRFVRKFRGEVSRAAHGVIYTDPGEEAQVDCASKPSLLAERIELVDWRSDFRGRRT